MLLSTLNDLITARHILPVCDNQPEVLPAEEFYREIMKHISLLECTKRKAYYGLDIGGIEYLAHKMKMKKVDLLSKLKEYNFLYLTKSSRGYQTNVRFKIEPHEREVLEKGDPSLVGKDYATEWMYCIYKMEYLGNAIEE